MAESAAGGSSAAPGVKGRVLVVDDEPFIGRSFQRLLSAAGYDVTFVGDGESAVALLGQKEFDVILSDISMPGMDGIQLLHAVRERDLDVPVILITGTPALETATKAIEYGALRYLLKPVEAGHLMEVVGQAVRLRKMAWLKRQALEVLGILDKQVSDRAGLEASFGKALDSLWMAYQPILSWGGRDIYAFEALLRSDESSLPNPGAILDAAERLDRIHDLSRTIRRAAASAAAAREGVRLFVNLHPKDLSDDELYSSSAPLSAHAQRVVLEITERASLQDVRDLRNRVTALKQMGYRIALDDLGAGYAGLSSFAELDPDVVKLDMSLVRDVDKTPPKQLLIRSMASLCKEMGIQVVCEGVETAAERDMLIELGCDLLQGYLFARPGKGFPDPQW